jgi:hypothetical protein
MQITSFGREWGKKERERKLVWDSKLLHSSHGPSHYCLMFLFLEM